ncbi:MAG: sigma-70 family RNA polymerase sigma factor [Bacteroidales bacterium]|nr:sigma-70 family RNA polymerase sigma factor [Bacteroidales bacterium]
MEVVPNFSTEKATRDYQLVRRAREKGDERAFADLMQMYREPLYLMLLKMTNNPNDADDLTIEAFSKAFNSLHLYTPTYAFSTWLFTIASNHCIDYIRKKRIQTIYIEDMTTHNGDESYAFQMPSDIGNPEDEFIREQRKEILREVVGQLKPHYRKMVELRYFEERSYEEIAEEMKMPLGTVKVQLFRARDLLQNILRKRNDLI